jgi:hypothetical protein
MMAPGFAGGLVLGHPQTFREIMGGGGRQAVRKELVQAKRFANNTAAAGR